jgi:thioredoxin
MENKINVDDSSFNKEVIEKSKEVPVVVDFWATWCMPCLMLGPVIEKLAQEYDGKFILAKLNVDEARATSQMYSVMSIPTVKMFKDGKVVDEFIGSLPAPQIRSWLDKNIEE